MLALACCDGGGYVNRHGHDDTTVSAPGVETSAPSASENSTSGSAAPESGASGTAPRVVKKSRVEEQLKPNVEQTIGKSVDELACDGDLTMTPGNTVDCAASYDGEWHEVQVTVNPEGSDPNTKFEVDDDTIPKPSYAN
ncbi:MAG: DUF4333 domain-containing protein [Gordonia sp. (in: high G+C Gram-positive bacteria)]|uniref:DUF4333 domain-containing protein n=1 Tax=Gordonia sp. (in: high G+C Gram-positive bacteria) TaxID=84139 RepID=UPI0039E402ED